MEAELHQWDVLEAVGEGTAQEWFGLLFKAIGGVHFEVDSLVFMLGQTAVMFEHDSVATLAMIDDRRKDLVDLEAAAAKLSEVVGHMLANLERNTSVL